MTWLPRWLRQRKPQPETMAAMMPDEQSTESAPGAAPHRGESLGGWSALRFSLGATARIRLATDLEEQSTETVPELEVQPARVESTHTVPPSPEQVAVDREFERFQKTRRRLQAAGEWYNDEQPNPRTRP